MKKGTTCNRLYYYDCFIYLDKDIIETLIITAQNEASAKQKAELYIKFVYLKEENVPLPNLKTRFSRIEKCERKTSDKLIVVQKHIEKVIFTSDPFYSVIFKDKKGYLILKNEISNYQNLKEWLENEKYRQGIRTLVNLASSV